MQIEHASEYTHVNHLWNDDGAARLTPPRACMYRSNLLGADQRITNTGGGTRPQKLRERRSV